MFRSLAAAFSFGTVLPVPFDGGPIGRGAICAFPVVGIALGAAVSGILWTGAHAFGGHSLLTGVLGVATVLLLTRGLHIDGLADTADGLGCYGPPERALQVMREGSAGPFGVAAIAVATLAQASAFAAMPASIGGYLAVGTALIAGRVAATIACRRGIPSASGSSLGAQVAGSQPYFVVALWVIAVAVLSTLATENLWQGPVVVLCALALTTMLVDHCVRRFGGITGDVLGAAVEVATTVTAIGLIVGR